jgi:hypothetical protein
LLKAWDLVALPACDAGGAATLVCREAKMSHEIAPTGIERYFICRSLRSDLLSSTAGIATKIIF